MAKPIYEGLPNIAADWLNAVSAWSMAKRYSEEKLREHLGVPPDCPLKPVKEMEREIRELTPEVAALFEKEGIDPTALWEFARQPVAMHESPYVALFRRLQTRLAMREPAYSAEQVCELIGWEKKTLQNHKSKMKRARKELPAETMPVSFWRAWLPADKAALLPT